MFSRTCFTSQLRNYTRSIRNNKIHRLKFSTTVLLRTEKIDDKTLRVDRNNNLAAKTEYFNRIKQFFSKTNIGSLGAAGLVLDANTSNSPEKGTIISEVADQTASRILDTTTISTTGHIENASEVPSSTIVDASQVSTNTVVEANVLSPVNTEKITTASSESITIDPIPEPPPVPEFLPVNEVVEQLNALGQPTFASMGLGGWTPVGLIQQCFEFCNVTMGIPWWGTIAIGTLIIRLAMFPLVVIAQRNSAKMANNLPGLQAIQMKLTEARQCGNQLEAAKYSQEMMIFMKEKGVNPLKNMIVPMAQMPVFISFFMSLRQMANIPVESLKTGGMLWFTDLTLPDQFYILPIVTSVTLWATIELGADSAKLSTQNLQTMKYVLRALPLIVFPFTVNFPGAVLVYWTTSNFVSLAQVGFLKIPQIREYFNIERPIRYDPSTLPIKPKGFTEGLKDSWTNIKISKEIEERRRLDELRFRRAGKGPIVKTYKYDPTKQMNPTSSAPISAKKR
ncbi:mitochondrial inner membrane protein OXA1L isoform X2 [Harmonia axyridis]|uniref:mitochondrial inner membrane protein OXA1L isoform X2 n=1 Tax=Harmonia axyridis TaxID=115357 RepID=UPI001E279C8D|nr:mitochondrial inner membrane protein OXA1L isoform X2 [Harmonia axyridis]